MAVRIQDTDRRTFLLALGITAAIAALSALGGQNVARLQYVLLGLGSVIIGIPHGATDNHVYRSFFRRPPRPRRMAGFYLTYLFSALAYGLLWWLAPVAALVLFLVMSMYHFGQSSLFVARGPESSPVKKLSYVGMGAFYLLPPILLRYPEAEPVIAAITGRQLVSLEQAATWAPWVTAAVTLGAVGIVVGMAAGGAISRNVMLRELLLVGVLLALFLVSPLFVSFIVYWALWHSLNTAMEVYPLLPPRPVNRPVIRFARAAAPLTLITFVGIAGIFLGAGVLDSLQGTVALYFVLIAAMTLPHSVVMERMYQRVKSAA